MSMRSNTALLAGFLVVLAICAQAASRAEMRIRILSSETHSVNVEGSDVPKNCDGANFDAYCHNSKSVVMTNTLVVQEGNEAPFRVACTVDTRWSRCVPLPTGQTFEARRDKHGIVVYYIDDNGKARSQLYTLVAGSVPAAPAVSAATAGAEPPKTPAGNSGQAGAGTGAAPVVDLATESSSRPTVKCSFSSTPAGADVTLDGRYVGSTPSVLGLTTGNHVVVISMAGFQQWKRDLTVAPGSELTVNAVFQKAQ